MEMGDEAISNQISPNSQSKVNLTILEPSTSDTVVLLQDNKRNPGLLAANGREDARHAGANDNHSLLLADFGDRWFSVKLVVVDLAGAPFGSAGVFTVRSEFLPMERKTDQRRETALGKGARSPGHQPRCRAAHNLLQLCLQ